MSNRNFDSSTIIKILKAQNAANFYNRQNQVVAGITTVPAQVEIQPANPQTENFDADTIPNIRAGQQAYYFKNYPIVTTIDPINYVPTNTTVPDPPPPDTTSLIYSFVYSGDPIDVLTRIPVITTGVGGTLTISSSFTQVGTTYTITVSLISFIDNGSTTKGISFNSSVAVNNFYKTIPVTIQQFGSIPLSRAGSVFINLAQLTISPTTIPVILPTTLFSSLFFGCTNFNSNISAWDTTNVTAMDRMFQSATAFNQPIGTWNTSAVRFMSNMFNSASAFNSDISGWNTGAVTTMAGMFQSATVFNQPIGTWNTAAVESMDSMFRVAQAFNQPIGDWNTALVMNMQAMFNSASAFNQNISYQAVGSKWNTAAVTNMAVMFSGATVFNNGQAAGGTTAPLGWLTTGVTLPIATFRTSSALTNANNVNSANAQIGGAV
jgi:surface protein